VSSVRRLATIPFGAAWLAATLDGPPDATTGWVFVTGGTQTRVGPHRLYERLARYVADRGEAVIRFDRPGVGDSPGEDAGYLDSGTGIAVAARALREAFPQVTTLAGFGLCDGATALALHGRAAGISRLVVANPWVVEPTDDLPPAAAIRGYYARRLLDPRAWWKLVCGGVNLGRLARGVARSATRDDAALAERFAKGVPDATAVVLAQGDGTAQAFDGAWRQLADAPAIETITVASASHSFAEPAAFDALARAVSGQA
jgi:exosortase A-associated hydrolase 1